MRRIQKRSSVLSFQFSYAINWTQRHIPAIIVHMTQNSEEEGNALADVLFGDYNPARPALVQRRGRSRLSTSCPR